MVTFMVMVTVTFMVTERTRPPVGTDKWGAEMQRRADASGAVAQKA